MRHPFFVSNHNLRHILGSPALMTSMKVTDNCRCVQRSATTSWGTSFGAATRTLQNPATVYSRRLKTSRSRTNWTQVWLKKLFLVNFIVLLWCKCLILNTSKVKSRIVVHSKIGKRLYLCTRYAFHVSTSIQSQDPARRLVLPHQGVIPRPYRPRPQSYHAERGFHRRGTQSGRH